MSFNDVRRISYDRLLTRTATDTPYRNSGNAYPLGERRYSDRHFRKEADGTFTIWYADREVIDNKHGKDNDKKTNFDKNRDYYDSQMLGRVHPDNTFEFTARLSNGENMLLTQGLCAWVHHDRSKGGTVYQKRRAGNSGLIVHPVFKGLRINCDTGEAVTPYEVFLPVVKRKAAADVMKGYQEFITTFEVMINSMDERGIWEVYCDLYKYEGEGDKGVWRGLGMETVKRLIDEKKYVDAGCLFTLFNKSSHMRWRVEWVMDNETQSGVPQLTHRWKDSAISDVKNNLRKEILKQHVDVFNAKPLERGAPLPSSQWGLIVQVDGKPVERV